MSTPTPDTTQTPGTHHRDESKADEEVHMSPFQTFDDADELDDILAKAKGREVLVDFSATWCGPCKRIAPYLKERARAQCRWVVAKTDNGDDEDLGRHVYATYGVEINAFPFFVVFEPVGDTHVVNRKRSWGGASEKNIDALLCVSG